MILTKYISSLMTNSKSTTLSGGSCRISRRRFRGRQGSGNHWQMLSMIHYVPLLHHQSLSNPGRHMLLKQDSLSSSKPKSHYMVTRVPRLLPTLVSKVRLEPVPSRPPPRHPLLPNRTGPRIQTPSPRGRQRPEKPSKSWLENVLPIPWQCVCLRKKPESVEHV